MRAIYLFAAMLACGCSPAIQGKALDASLACVRSAIESALASCGEDEGCKAKVKADHAPECEAVPDLCAEGSTPIAGGE